MEKEPDDSLPSQRAFQQTVEQLQATLTATHQGWFELDLSTGKAVVNDQYALMLGHDPTTFTESLDTWYQRVHPEDLLAVRAIYQDYRTGKRPDYRVEFRERTVAGAWIWILSVGAFVAYDPQSAPLRLAGTRMNICARKEAELRQREADQRLAFTLDAAKLGDFMLDLRTGITEHSMQHDRCFGHGEPIRDWNYEIFLSYVAQPDRAWVDATIRAATAEGRDYEIEFRVHWPDGTIHWLWSKGHCFLDDEGRPERAAGIVGDITARKQAAAEIDRLAYSDHLTGLPNRRWLMEHVEAACSQARADRRVDALLFLDLDHFKRVNDVRGHAVGDTLLKCLAERIRTTLGERGTVGRLGGDEFVIHLPGVGQHIGSAAEQGLQIAHELSLAIQQPMEVEGQFHHGTVSTGITLFPKAGENADDLLREADTAMYRAKASGRNCVALYEAGMQAELEAHLALERDLSLALSRGELQLHCQPQVDHAGGLAGAELLLRWTHATRGNISPAIFIALAEESDLIVRLGNWVIEQACRIEVDTRQRGMTMPLSINISPKQFKTADFIARTRATISATGACAARLIFEVTEGLLIEDVNEAVERMNALRDLGIRFSIDDFGTGYSSLAYLKRLPLYELKIDKSFVDGLPGDPDDVAIVQSILSIARHLRLRVIAEGVETREQARFLSDSSCDGFQGFLFGRPVPLAQFLSDHA